MFLEILKIAGIVALIILGIFLVIIIFGIFAICKACGMHSRAEEQYHDYEYMRSQEDRDT